MSRFQFDSRTLGQIPVKLKVVWMGLTASYRQPTTIYLMGGDESDQTPLQQFESWCTQNKAANAQILLAGEFTRQFVEPLNSSSKNFEKIRGGLLKVVRKKFKHHNPVESPLQIYTAWSDSLSYGGCCLQGIDLVALRKIASKYKVHISSMEPWWAWMLRWLSKKTPDWNHTTVATLVLVEGKLFTWLHCEDGHLVNIQQRRLAEPRLTDLHDRINELNSVLGSIPKVWLAGYGLTPEMLQEKNSWKILEPMSAAIMPNSYLQS